MKSFALELGTALAAILTATTVSAEKIPDEFKTSGFALGCQAYTFNRFSVFEAIEKRRRSGNGRMKDGNLALVSAKAGTHTP